MHAHVERACRSSAHRYHPMVGDPVAVYVGEKILSNIRQTRGVGKYKKSYNSRILFGLTRWADAPRPDFSRTRGIRFSRSGNAKTERGNGICRSANAKSTRGIHVCRSGNAKTQRGNGVCRSANAKSTRGIHVSSSGNAKTQRPIGKRQNPTWKCRLPICECQILAWNSRFLIGKRQIHAWKCRLPICECQILTWNSRFQIGKRQIPTWKWLFLEHQVSRELVAPGVVSLMADQLVGGGALVVRIGISDGQV